MSTRYKGNVKWFKAEKGFGFIVPSEPINDYPNHKGDIFIHFSNIKMNGFKTLAEGQEVTFGLENGDKGIQAVELEVTSD